MIVTLEKVITVTEWGYNSDIIMIYNSDIRIICDSDMRKGDNSDEWYNCDIRVGL